MTLIEVLDTAVKIGLGAAISGIAAYLLARDSHTRDLEKVKYIRRQEALEMMADNAEKHFSAWRDLASSLGGMYGGSNPPDPEFSEAQWRRIIEQDRAFISTHASFGHMLSRIGLLGLSDVIKPVNAYIALMREFRDPMMLSRTTPPREEFERVRAGVKKALEDFYSAMGDAYAALPGRRA